MGQETNETPGGPPPSPNETACYLVCTLALAYALAVLFLFTGGRHAIIIHALMCVPGFLALAFMWVLHRQPPRTVGFAFTGWGPWLFALLFPLGFEVVAVALAYAVRAATGHRDFIFLQPENVKARLLGWEARGVAALPLTAATLLLTVSPWLLIGFLHRRRPARWYGGVLLTAAWVPVFFVPSVLRGGSFDLPGELGEEVGWRGYLVRRWSVRPLAAALLSMAAWALFHLPVPFFEGPRGRYLQNLAFLASIAASAPFYQALYLWSRSVWPCAVLHLSWNTWNVTILGDVYGWEPGLFGGQFWVFNGEGPFGLLLNGTIAAWLLWLWSQRPAASSALETPSGCDLGMM